MSPCATGWITPLMVVIIDHYRYYKESGGDLHGNISVDTIVYLEEPKKGGLLHFDPPIRMSGDSEFGFRSPPPRTLSVDSRFSAHAHDRD